jgi:leucyl-tRNA synthetase
VLHDLGHLNFTEPFTRLLNQGMVLMDGSAMSKSRGNLVKLSDELTTHGVDAIRVALVFAGPPEDDIDWADVSPAGSLKFLNRAWRIADDVTSKPGVDFKSGDLALRKVTHKSINDISIAVESFRFNVCIARIMELVNATRKAIDSGCGPADAAVREAAEAIAISLSLVAPYTAEDMWEKLGHQPAIANAGWPTVDPALLEDDSVEVVLQINGKIIDRIDVSPSISKDDLEKAAKANAKIAEALTGAEIKKAIVVPPKLVNFVI